MEDSNAPPSHFLSLIQEINQTSPPSSPEILTQSWTTKKKQPTNKQSKVISSNSTHSIMESEDGSTSPFMDNERNCLFQDSNNQLIDNNPTNSNSESSSSLKKLSPSKRASESGSFTENKRIRLTPPTSESPKNTKTSSNLEFSSTPENEKRDHRVFNQTTTNKKSIKQEPNNASSSSWLIRPNLSASKTKKTLVDYWGRNPKTETVTSNSSEPNSPSLNKQKNISEAKSILSDLRKSQESEKEFKQPKSFNENPKEEFDTIEVDQLAEVRRKRALEKKSLPSLESNESLSAEPLSTPFIKSKSNFDLVSGTNTPKKKPFKKPAFTFTEEIPKTIEEEDEDMEFGKEETKQNTLSPVAKRVPNNFINATLYSNWKEFKSSLLEKNSQACIGVIYRYNFTNFREEKKQEFPKSPDNVVSFVLLPSKAKHPYYLEFENEEQGNLVPISERWKFFVEFIESDQVIKICYDWQNTFKYVLYSNYFEVKPKNVVDPAIASWIYEPELDSYEFREILFRYLQVEDKLSSSNSQKIGKDLIDCLRLWSHLKDCLEKENLMEPFLQQEMKMSSILAKMELNGIGFNQKEKAKNKRILEQRIEELKKQADKLVGHPILLSSPLKVSNVLFNELKLENPESKKKHKKNATHQSTSESVLKSLKDQHPFPGIVLGFNQIPKFRHCQKILSNWIDVLEKKVIPSPKSSNLLPRIHTTWRQTNTATGRLASINPNLQQLPKQPLSLKLEETSNDLCINVRNQFSSDEGFSLVAFDYSQIEMRILTHMSQDRYLLEFFQGGKDIHRLIASRWLGKPVEKISDTEREQAKRIVYGILYGMGPHSLSEIISVSVKEAEKFISAFLGKFPELSAFLDKVVVEAKKNKFIKTLFNRRRLLPDINSIDTSLAKRCERQAVNSVIQGTAADLVKKAMIQVCELLESNPICKNARLLLQIHDELVFELENETLEQVAKLIKTTMENAIQLSVDIPVTASFGVLWGSMQPIENLNNPQTKLSLQQESKSSQQLKNSCFNKKKEKQLDLSQSRDNETLELLLNLSKEENEEEFDSEDEQKTRNKNLKNGKQDSSSIDFLISMAD